MQSGLISASSLWVFFPELPGACHTSQPSLSVSMMLAMALSSHSWVYLLFSTRLTFGRSDYRY